MFDSFCLYFTADWILFHTLHIFLQPFSSNSSKKMSSLERLNTWFLTCKMNLLFFLVIFLFIISTHVFQIILYSEELFKRWVKCRWTNTFLETPHLPMTSHWLLTVHRCRWPHHACPVNPMAAGSVTCKGPRGKSLWRDLMKYLLDGGVKKKGQKKRQIHGKAKQVYNFYFIKCALNWLHKTSFWYVRKI